MIKFALIGCGRVAQRHAKHISNYGILTSVCGINQTKATSLTKTYKVPYYLSIDELIEQQNQTDGIVYVHLMDCMHNILLNIKKRFSCST